MQRKSTTFTIFSFLLLSGATAVHGQQSDSGLPSSSIPIDQLVLDAESAMAKPLAVPVPPPLPSTSGLEAMRNLQSKLNSQSSSARRSETSGQSAPANTTAPVEDQRSIEELNAAASILRQRVLSEKARTSQAWLDRSNQLLNDTVLKRPSATPTEPEPAFDPQKDVLVQEPQASPEVAQAPYTSLKPTTLQQPELLQDDHHAAPIHFNSLQTGHLQVPQPNVVTNGSASTTVMVQAVCPRCGKTHWIPMSVR